jgi:hypothetical protein
VNKVVYNASYGGFSISKECAEWLADRGHRGAAALIEEGDADGFYGYWDGARHDALLVMAVEALGEKASGNVANLQVKRLIGKKYIIREYDGDEVVVEPDDINWIEVSK